MERRDRWSAAWLAFAAASLAVLAAGCGGRVGVAARSIPRGVVLTPATARYEITGRTIAEIGASIRAASGRRANIGSFSSSFRWSARFIEGGIGSSGCRLVDVRLDLNAVIEIPAWRRPADADSSAIAAWEAFVAFVDDHERTHESIALQYAGDLARALERLQSMSCPQLEAEANLETGRASRAMQERQERFDRDARSDPAGRWPPSSTTKP